MRFAGMALNVRRSDKRRLSTDGNKKREAIGLPFFLCEPGLLRLVDDPWAALHHLVLLGQAVERL